MVMSVYEKIKRGIDDPVLYQKNMNEFYYLVTSLCEQTVNVLDEDAMIIEISSAINYLHSRIPLHSADMQFFAKYFNMIFAKRPDLAGKFVRAGIVSQESADALIAKYSNENNKENTSRDNLIKKYRMLFDEIKRGGTINSRAHYTSLQNELYRLREEMLYKRNLFSEQEYKDAIGNIDRMIKQIDSMYNIMSFNGSGYPGR